MFKLTSHNPGFGQLVDNLDRLIDLADMNQLVWKCFIYDGHPERKNAGENVIAEVREEEGGADNSRKVFFVWNSTFFESDLFLKYIK